MRPIGELPELYQLEPREILLCTNDAESMVWVLCVWDETAGQWFVGDRGDLQRIEESRSKGTFVPTMTMRKPTHFFELPPLPPRPLSMYN